MKVNSNNYSSAKGGGGIYLAAKIRKIVFDGLPVSTEILRRFNKL